eukprot:5352-Heterococcus_DN1.PRE.1
MPRRFPLCLTVRASLQACVHGHSSEATRKHITASTAADSSRSTTEVDLQCVVVFHSDAALCKSCVHERTTGAYTVTTRYCPTTIKATTATATVDEDSQRCKETPVHTATPCKLMLVRLLIQKRQKVLSKCCRMLWFSKIGLPSTSSCRQSNRTASAKAARSKTLSVTSAPNSSAPGRETHT